MEHPDKAIQVRGNSVRGILVKSPARTIPVRNPIKATPDKDLLAKEAGAKEVKVAKAAVPAVAKVVKVAARVVSFDARSLVESGLFITVLRTEKPYPRDCTRSLHPLSG